MTSRNDKLDRWRVAQQMLDESGRAPGVAEANAVACIQGLANAGDGERFLPWPGLSPSRTMTTMARPDESMTGMASIGSGCIELAGGSPAAASAGATA